MTTNWMPYRESVWTTLVRTGAIVVVMGAVMTVVSRGGLARWPVAIVLMLWPALGGHFVELFFLNWLRPRLSAARFVQVTARLITWFNGGTVLAMGMGMTATALGAPERWMQPTWWIGGLGFIGIELVAHLVLHLTGRPNFYDGRG